jgi:hypothetical protein
MSRRGEHVLFYTASIYQFDGTEQTVACAASEHTGDDDVSTAAQHIQLEESPSRIARLHQVLGL